ncbi:MAG: hypothetical protein LBT74_00135 [Acidobacteriota bacterium]|jgi:polysaccharide chain length determinant protein (PEP-CTERM system associated)|nr:hypothetical protein [Acidobacteriota bacterium]
MKDLSNLEVTDYFRILWNRRWYFLILFVLMSVGSAIYAVRAPDVYKSQARIRVDTTISSEEFMRTGAGSLVDERINAVREQLQSRAFLERMIESLQMYGFGTNPNFVMESAVSAARRQIGIERTSDKTFTVSFVANNPQFAQMVTRQLTNELIQSSSRDKVNTVRGVDQFVDAQLAEAEKDVKAQEERLTQFKLAHQGELPEQESAITSAIASLNNQYNMVENSIQQVQADQRNLDFQYRENQRANEERMKLLQALAPGTSVPVSGGERRPTPDELELAKKKEELGHARTKYTESHPDVVRLNKDVQRLEQQVRSAQAAERPDATAPSSSDETTTAGADGGTVGRSQGETTIDNIYRFRTNDNRTKLEKYEKEKRDIQAQIRLYTSKLTMAPAVAQQLTGIQRELDKALSKYKGLESQKIKTDLGVAAETDRKNDTYQVTDEANLPVNAEYPNRMQIVLMGVGGGFILGIGAAFARELLDSTISSEEEAKKLLNLPVLVALPLTVKKTDGPSKNQAAA